MMIARLLRSMLVLLIAIVAPAMGVCHWQAPASATESAAPRTTAPAIASDWRVDRDHWYRFEIDGKPCGWMRTQVLSAKDGSLRRSTGESTLRFGRAGQSVEISVFTQFDETPRGEPRHAMLRQRSGDVPIEQVFRFDPADRSRVSVVSTQGGRTVESLSTLPDSNWLTPIAADALAASRRAAGANDYKIRTVDLSTGLRLVDRIASRVGAGHFAHGDRTLPTTRWSVTDTLMPVATIEEWSTDDVLVRTTTAMAFGKLEMTLADEAAARASTRGPAFEVMVSTLVRPDRPIDDVFGVGRGRFRVRTKNGDALDLPSIGAQRVVRETPSSLAVVVDETVTSPATAEEMADARFRQASVTIDSNDDAIVRMAQRALGPHRAAPAKERAVALALAVHRHITKKGMAAAFASASETVRSREGDCTEHAVLLAALLRAEGIPSRVVSGLVYCPEFAGERGVFGWHMWTQAILDGAWVDLDATLPGPTAFHGGHLASGSSAQEHGAIDAEWAALVSLVGNLEIEVLETTPRERTGRP